MEDRKLLLEKTKTMAEKMEDIDKPAPYFDFWKYNTLKGKNKKTLENKFRSDIVARMWFWEDAFYPSWYQSIKDYTMDTTDRELDLRKKKRGYLTNEKQPIVRTYVDRLMQSLFRTQFFIKAYPLSAKTAKKTTAVQKAIEWCFASANAKKGMYDMAKTALLQWPWYARTSFNIPDEKAKDIKDQDTDHLFHISKFYANFEWVSEFSLYGDPGIPFYEQKDIIYRKVLPMKTILKKIWSLGVKLEKDVIEYLVTNTQEFSWQDYEKIRLIKYYSSMLCDVKNRNYNYDNFFNLTLDNKQWEYTEHWTEDNLVLYINGYLVYDGPNPLNSNPERPPRVHPFKFIWYTRDPGTWIADWLGPMLAGQQRLYDALYNMSFDLLKFAAWPMFLLQPWQSIEGSEKLLDYEPFTFKQVRGPGKIEALELPKPAPEVSKAMSDILEMANFMIAPSMYNQIQGMSRSATDSQFRFEWLKDAILWLVTSMNEMLNVVAEERLRDMKEKMPNKFKIPVFWTNKLAQERAEITADDLNWDFIFEWDSESIRDINKVVERSQLQELTSFLTTFGNDPISWKRFIDNEKLIAEGLDLFNKNPDILLTDKEYQSKMKKAQTEAIKMQSELSKYQQDLAGEQQQWQQQDWGNQAMMQAMQWWWWAPTQEWWSGPAPQAPVPGSNVNSNLEEGSPNEAAAMWVASILKQVNE